MMHQSCVGQLRQTREQRVKSEKTGFVKRVGDKAEEGDKRPEAR